MKRLFILLVTLIAAGTLSGCSLAHELFLDERKATEEVGFDIVAALDARDEDALRELFSPEALAEADDFSDGFAHIMRSYDAPSIEVQMQPGSYYDHYGSPGRTKSANARVIIKTENNEFYLYFEYWLIHEAKPEMLGVYRMRLYTHEEHETPDEKRQQEIDEASTAGKPIPEWNYGATYNRPGIYWPEWVNRQGQKGRVGDRHYPFHLMRKPLQSIGGRLGRGTI
jgi:hypothetical protein